MDVAALCKSLKISSSLVVAKANEYERLATVRLGGSSNIQDSAKNVCCVELACRKLQVDINHNLAVRFSGLSNAKYNLRMNFYQELVGVRRVLTGRDLCVQFGCVQLASEVIVVLNRLKAVLLRNVSEDRKRFADFSKPVYMGTAFLVTAQKHGSAVDRKRLLTVLTCTNRELLQTTDLLLQACPDLLSSHKRKKKAQRAARSKRKQEEATGEFEADEEDELIEQETQEQVEQRQLEQLLWGTVHHSKHPNTTKGSWSSSSPSKPSSRNILSSSSSSSSSSFLSQSSSSPAAGRARPPLHNPNNPNNPTGPSPGKMAASARVNNPNNPSQTILSSCYRHSTSYT